MKQKIKLNINIEVVQNGYIIRTYDGYSTGDVKLSFVVLCIDDIPGIIETINKLSEDVA